MGINKSAFEKIATWEKYKANSTWHFDSKADPTEKAYSILCKFVGNWQSGIDLAIDECEERLVKVDHERVRKGTASTEELDLPILTGSDSLSTLYWKEIQCVNSFDESGNITDKFIETNPAYAPFLKMINSIGMYEPHSIRVTIQRMGQITPWHIDENLQYFTKRSNMSKRYLQVAGNNHLRLRRVFISLTPYDYGQVWHFGNSEWKNYDAGECVTFDWKNMPHATATIGYTPRINLQATGFVNDHFDWLVTNGSKDYIINI